MQEVVERLVELFPAVETLLGPNQHVIVGRHSRSDRRREHGRLFIHLDTQRRCPHIERPELFVVLIRFRRAVVEEFLIRGHFPWFEPQLLDVRKLGHFLRHDGRIGELHGAGDA